MHLGIDLGTSAVKSVLVNDNGAQIGAASASLEVQSPQPGWSEQNPSDWWLACQTSLANLRENHSAGFKNVCSIGLSGQMHGATVLDANHQPLRPAILWNDGRSQKQCRQLSSSMPEIGQIAGVPPMPGFTAPKIMWLAEHESELHKKIAHIVLPKDYLRFLLTGELATDMADAAGTMWLDQQNRCWSDAVCEHTRTKAQWLPTCLEGTAVSGSLKSDIASQLGLPSGIPVAAGAGDAAAGAMGIGAVRDGDAFISLGTSGQLFVASSSYRPNPESAVHAYAHCVPNTWFQMGCMLNGASPMQWFSSVADTGIERLLFEAADVSDSNVPLFLPYLTGERTPHNDTGIRGAFVGLGAKTDRAEMMRGVVDAIAYSFCDAKDALAAAGTVITAPSAIGGGTRSDLVLQAMADALGIPITRSKDSDTGPAFGAARLAMVASGAKELGEVLISPEPDRQFLPIATNAQYHADRLAQFRALYGALSTWQRRGS